MVYSIRKGDALEQAVRAIETAILKASPSYAENTFLIESKKIVVVEGVKHEIDIWVDIDLGKGYKSIFIFECKNWETKKVDKNEIIVFSEKIDAVQAQRGFFVAKSFTGDAEAQANKDPRIELLLAKEHSVELTPVPFDFHFVILGRTQAELLLDHILHGSTERFQQQSVDIHSAVAKIGNADLNFRDYIQKWIAEACGERLNTFPSGKLAQGTYELETTSRRQFENLNINNIAVQFASLRVRFSVQLIRPAVISHFEVETRGRVLSLAPVQMNDGSSVDVQFVERT